MITGMRCVGLKKNETYNYFIRKITKRYFWPHPYAKDRGLLWVKIVVGYEYFLNGKPYRW